MSLLEQVDLTVAQEQAAAAFDGYLAGLAAAGWQCDSQKVRFGYLATALLRYGVGMVPVSINILTDPHVHEWADQAFGYPIEAMVDYWVEAARWRLALMAELVGL